MFAFALVALGRDEDRLATLGAMLRAWPSAPSEGDAVAHTSNAAAGILRWAVVNRDRRVAPLRDQKQQLLAAGDVRLYNRDELKLKLEIPSSEEPTDLELAWLSFLRWGREAPCHLVGDFAFAVWDARRNSLFAVRDHMGARPLYYRCSTDAIYVASDVRQLLPAMAHPFDSVNPNKLLERVCRRLRTHGLTFFTDISFLRPGHYLLVDDKGVRETRYWFPPLGTSIRHSYEEECEELRFMFRRAVRDRLESDYPLVAHSSGGFDSSSIVMIADELYHDEPGRAPLVTTAATMPGMPCDDSYFMDAVARQTQFENVRWSAYEDNFADLDSPSPAYPGERRGPGGGPRTDLAIAHERGARTLISGVWGDSVLFAWGILRDLFRACRFGQVAKETFGRHPFSGALRRFLKSGLGILSPRTALGALNRRASRAGEPPEWLGPELRAIYPPPLDMLDPGPAAWPSHLICEMWARITSPQAAHTSDVTTRYGADDGVEVRMPFADVRLIEYVLRIPWKDRIPHGDARRLGRDAFGGILPREFKQRLDQGSVLPLWGRAARRMLPRVKEILRDGLWLSEGYINRRIAMRLVNRCLDQGEAADPGSCITAIDFGVIETWMRRVFEYDTATEVCR